MVAYWVPDGAGWIIRILNTKFVLVPKKWDHVLAKDNVPSSSISSCLCESQRQNSSFLPPMLWSCAVLETIFLSCGNADIRDSMTRIFPLMFVIFVTRETNQSLRDLLSQRAELYILWDIRRGSSHSWFSSPIPFSILELSLFEILDRTAIERSNGW